MTGTGLSPAKPFPATLQKKPQSSLWFIITSEEIGSIRRHLSDIEPDVTEQSRERTREISSIIDLVERRLA